MKEIIGIAFMFICFNQPAFAVDGHNGIKFKMTQKQLEAMGFSCKSSSDSKEIIAVCNHVEMTGVAFGIPTNEYEVKIGKNKKVYSISLELVGTLSFADSMDLKQSIEKLFPHYDKANESFRRAWIADDKSYIIWISDDGMPPYIKAKNTLVFFRP